MQSHSVQLNSNPWQTTADSQGGQSRVGQFHVGKGASGRAVSRFSDAYGASALHGAGDSFTLKFAGRAEETETQDTNKTQQKKKKRNWKKLFAGLGILTALPMLVGGALLTLSIGMIWAGVPLLILGNIILAASLGPFFNGGKKDNPPQVSKTLPQVQNREDWEADNLKMYIQGTDDSAKAPVKVHLENAVREYLADQHAIDVIEEMILEKELPLPSDLADFIRTKAAPHIVQAALIELQDESKPILEEIYDADGDYISNDSEVPLRQFVAKLRTEPRKALVQENGFLSSSRILERWLGQVNLRFTSLKTGKYNGAHLQAMNTTMSELRTPQDEKTRVTTNEKLREEWESLILQYSKDIGHLQDADNPWDPAKNQEALDLFWSATLPDLLQRHRDWQGNGQGPPEDLFNAYEVDVLKAMMTSYYYDLNNKALVESYWLTRMAFDDYNRQLGRKTVKDLPPVLQAEPEPET